MVRIVPEAELPQGHEAEKRFTLGRGIEKEFIRERLHTLQDVIQETRKTHPELLSVCIYGSMARGDASPESDIDGEAFLDMEQLPRDEQEKVLDNKGEQGHAPVVRPDIELQRKFLLPLREAVQQRAGLIDEQVKGIRLLAMSHEIVDQHIDALVRQVEAFHEHERRSKEWWESRPSFNEGDNVDAYTEALQKYESQYPGAYPDFPSASWNLRSLFHMDVGGGVRPYREYVLEQLQEKGSSGEEAWKKIIEGTEMLEQHMSAASGKRYPKTLHEATALYGSAEADSGEKTS